VNCLKLTCRCNRPRKRRQAILSSR
jgi:hypothetical protein